MKRIGIIGCGHWGPNYLRNFSQLEDSSVLVCCDLSKDNLDKVKKHYRSIEVVEDYKDVLRDKRIDAVVIATPARTHYKIAKDALSAGKHILLEKPMALNYADCKKLVNLAKEKKRILMVGHTFLFNPAVRKLKDYIKKGAVGKIYYLHATRTHLGLVRNDVNVSWDLVPHDISIFSYLLGEMPISVSALGGSFLRSPKQDVVFINLIYPKGIIANIHASWADSNKVREIQVIGSRARVVFDDLNSMEKIKLYKKGISVDKSYANFGEFQLLLRDGDILSPKIGPEEPLRLQCQHFLNCLKNGKKPFVDGEDGASVVKIMNAINKSLVLGARVVKV
ncbi:MAG: Gfo/Idh/MocA family oxidoreductase [Candidatus Omnitrophica bacterium]|nr:Gfo/Idh/MocA family oxidoreductase [Candidatus Omnitrophota bacterium]